MNDLQTFDSQLLTLVDRDVAKRRVTLDVLLRPDGNWAVSAIINDVDIVAVGEGWSIAEAIHDLTNELDDEFIGRGWVV